MTDISELPVTYVGGWAATKAKVLYPKDAVDLAPDELEPLVRIEDIRDKQCRWPIEMMTWCGRETSGSIYCETHSKRAKPR